MSTVKVCPKCDKYYTGYPATSRFDSTVQVCPDCGMKEALQVFYQATKAKQKAIAKAKNVCDIQ